MNKKARKNIRLSLLFALLVFIIMLAAIFLVFGAVILLDHLGWLTNEMKGRFPFLYFALVSLVVGTILSFIFSRRPLRPLREIMDATDKIADGDYTVRVTPNGYDEFRQLAEKFNHMAGEIGSVEMLRNNFINNFSHEFKTPIVSIRGFAKMLKNDDLTETERNEYLDIIISESERLSELSANVLSLSKIEQQTILTDKKRFNISEQIRLVIAMLYSKWDSKHIDIVFDSEEIYYTGNEEMLKQVWINLFDNAIKFSPEYGTIEIKINQAGEKTVITVSDEGEGMSDETKAHIFDKFYQGDSSHATKGNGLGLAIVKKIIELHNGKVYVPKSDKSSTVFEVQL